MDSIYFNKKWPLISKLDEEMIKQPIISLYDNILNMNDKTKLIQSMKNLIHHLTLDHTQQRQIFDSFTTEDLSKMVANLGDSNSDLRKISLSLIAVLLHNNPQIQHDFCQKIKIVFAPGKVDVWVFQLILSCRLQKVGMNHGNMREVFRLIKDEVPSNQKNSLFWYIQLQNQQPTLRYSSSLSPAIDPVTQIAGIILQDYQPPIRNEPKPLTSICNPTQLLQNHNHNKKKSIIGLQNTIMTSASQNKALRNKSLNHERKYTNLNKQVSRPNKVNQLLNFQHSQVVSNKNKHASQAQRIYSFIQSKPKFIQIISQPPSRQNKVYPLRAMRLQHY